MHGTCNQGGMWLPMHKRQCSMQGMLRTTPGVTEPGTKMMSAIASIIDEKEPEEIERVIEDIVDPAGLFYRFSLPSH